jgi:deoxyxylulose-5-phosphate synthase
MLNDNGMSISKPQGAVSQYFDRLRLSHLYGDFKKQARRILSTCRVGALDRTRYHRVGEATKAMVNQSRRCDGSSTSGC